MFKKLILFIVVVVVAGLGLQRCIDGPLATALPTSLAGIPDVQPQLDKLKPDDRDLVLQYLKRSKGDVLPSRFADPDEPLTARTFEQAIRLQKAFNVKYAAQKQRAAALQAKRDEAYEPLRKAVSIFVAKREIVSVDEANGTAPVRGRAINNSQTLVVTYRLHNRSLESVVALKGAVKIRSDDDPDSLMGLAECWIDHSEPLPAGDVAEVRCANVHHRAGGDAEKLVALPESALRVTWEPKSITLGSGTVLHGPD